MIQLCLPEEFLSELNDLSTYDELPNKTEFYTCLDIDERNADTTSNGSGFLQTKDFQTGNLGKSLTTKQQVDCDESLNKKNQSEKSLSNLEECLDEAAAISSSCCPSSRLPGSNLLIDDFDLKFELHLGEKEDDIFNCIFM